MSLQTIDRYAHDIIKIAHEIKVESVRHGQRLKELNTSLSDIKLNIQRELGELSGGTDERSNVTMDSTT